MILPVGNQDEQQSKLFAIEEQGRPGERPSAETIVDAIVSDARAGLPLNGVLVSKYVRQNRQLAIPHLREMVAVLRDEIIRHIESTPDLSINYLNAVDACLKEISAR